MLGLSFLSRVVQFVSLRHSQSQSTLSLSDALESAPRAEETLQAEHYYYAGKESGNSPIDALADGLWLCHCGYENLLMHYKGDHPFKYLKCVQCAHVVCETCPTTEILTTVHDYPGRCQDFNKDNKDVPYCSVCTCGLSHRATMHKQHIIFTSDPCSCGRYPTKTDRRYFIGSIESWRTDPAARGAALGLEKRKVGTWATLKPGSPLDMNPGPQRTVPDVIRPPVSPCSPNFSCFHEPRCPRPRPRLEGTAERYGSYLYPETTRPQLPGRVYTVVNF